MYKNFESFTNEDAFRFGCKVVELVNEKGCKNVRIRVVKDGDIVFQYKMNGKVGDLWLDLKQHTVEETQQSSLYVFEHQEEYPKLVEESMKTYAICGGGYPLYINHEYHGCFIVSGLDHLDDHGLIIEAIERM